MKRKNAPSVYETLSTIDRRFEQILRKLEHLDQLTEFQEQAPIKEVGRAVRETRARTMFEILEVLHGCEEEEWTRLGRVREEIR